MIQFEVDSEAARRNKEISFFLFIAGAIAGLLNLRQTLPFGAGFEMYDLARNLASQGTFANPHMILPTGPSAIAPPLYPLMLAGAMKILPAPELVLLAAAVGNIVANAFTAAWLPRVSWLFCGKAGPGIAASAMWLLSVQLMPSWDVSYTVAGLLLFCLISASTAGNEKTVLFGVTGGLIAGALFLLNPSSVLIFLPWLVYLSIFRNTGLKQIIAYDCMVLITAVITVCPWVVRNHSQLGAFVVKTNLGLTLYASNNDCASPSLIADEQSGCYEIYGPNYSVKEAEALRNMGEVKYDHRRVADAENWIRTHPGPFMRLTLARFREFWFPRPVEHPFKVGVIWIATVLSIPGLGLMAYRRERSTIFTVFVLSIYPLLYYLVLSDVRYR